ncbi:MAG: hypothetical protein AAF611_22430 [Bacteroidota bacterium]
MKRNKKLKLNKIKLVNLENTKDLKGGANSSYCWTKPYKMCLLSKKDLDCTPDDPIKITTPNCNVY